MFAGPSVLVDASLRRRRRAIEACAFIARGIGLLSTLGVAVVTADLPAVLVAACYGGIAIMAVANALALAGWRRPDGPAYPWLSAAQLALDTVLVIGMVALFAVHDQRTTWPLLSVPIATAAVRHELRAALAVWAVTSASYAGVIALLGDRAPHPEDVPFALCIHLLLALVFGTQSAAFARQLADLQATRLALQHRATHDGLTGLPNRARLDEHAASHAGPMAVLLLDLDGFKPVNDALGHAAGDELLRQVADRLTGCLRAGDLAGRLGGDEFLVLLPDCDAPAAEQVAARIREAVCAPVPIDGRLVEIGVSIGTAVRRAGSAAGLPALTAEADAAMYRVKSARRGQRPAGDEPSPAAQMLPV